MSHFIALSHIDTQPLHKPTAWIAIIVCSINRVKTFIKYKATEGMILWKTSLCPTFRPYTSCMKNKLASAALKLKHTK